MKLAPSQYIRRIASALTREYGKSLQEYDTDISMAMAVLEELEDQLELQTENDATLEAFQTWKQRRLNEET